MSQKGKVIERQYEKCLVLTNESRRKSLHCLLGLLMVFINNEMMNYLNYKHLQDYGRYNI